MPATSDTQVLGSFKHEIKLLTEQKILKYSFGLFFIYLRGVFMQGMGVCQRSKDKEGIFKSPAVTS